jgi:hypothetical protein
MYLVCNANEPFENCLFQSAFFIFIFSSFESLKLKSLIYFILLLSSIRVLNELEPLMGIEPMTSSLPRKCSAPELQRLGEVEVLQEK